MSCFLIILRQFCAISFFFSTTLRAVLLNLVRLNLISEHFTSELKLTFRYQVAWTFFLIFHACRWQRKLTWRTHAQWEAQKAVKFECGAAPCRGPRSHCRQTIGATQWGMNEHMHSRRTSLGTLFLRAREPTDKCSAWAQRDQCTKRPASSIISACALCGALETALFQYRLIAHARNCFPWLRECNAVLYNWKRAILSFQLCYIGAKLHVNDFYKIDKRKIFWALNNNFKYL